MPHPFPTVSDPVLYTLPTGPHAGETRPATVTHVFPEGRINLDWSTDADNDGAPGERWAALVPYDPAGAIGTWRWPAHS